MLFLQRILLPDGKNFFVFIMKFYLLKPLRWKNSSQIDGGNK